MNISKIQILPPLEFKSPPPLPVVEKKPAYVEPVDVRKRVETPKENLPKDVVEKKNRDLENSLRSAIQSAEIRIHQATEAKSNTIREVENHAQLLRKAVDEGKDADWNKVNEALQKVETSSRSDGLAESDSRNFIDSLTKIINDGKKHTATSSNPLLLNASETVNKLTHQLNELNALVSQAREEAKVLNSYKELIDKSRQQFAMEMRNILPNVDMHARDKNLNEDELNALIAHAHKKVDQLRQQLVEQQVREEQHISRAIEEQKKADSRIAAEHLSVELKRIEAQKELEVERALSSERQSWEDQLEGKLKRASAAHSDHLEQVVRTQRQLFEIENAQKVEEAILIERDFHSRQMGAAISRLEGIESALSSRIALDNENRRAKQFWIACHNLIDTIKHGNKAGTDMDKRRLPLEETLKLLKEVNPEDNFVNTVITSFPESTKNQGIYTEQDLKNRFEKVYNLGRRTASIDENGGSLSGYLWSYVRSMFLVDVPRRFSDDDRFDPIACDNVELLARAKWYMDKGDMEGAMRVAQLLRGQPAQLARDWVVDTRTHLEARLLAQLLVVHAAATSIRTTY
ncbi:hypothetical protein WR25_22219 isoform A [Diploscapter pachys]|uniref:MICOS complex subunit MIC60 n=1 Tax=Diploscapter pachys TaxID=2018661 RepID=A0A2A2KRX6_9BILA|nr:hypothetical protein WR25_22219 isoform A [Diploscapter pachys]